MSKECRERECNNDCVKCDIYLKILAERAKDYRMQYAEAMTAKSDALYERAKKRKQKTQQNLLY